MATSNENKNRIKVKELLDRVQKIKDDFLAKAYYESEGKKKQLEQLGMIEQDLKHYADISDPWGVEIEKAFKETVLNHESFIAKEEAALALLYHPASKVDTKHTAAAAATLASTGSKPLPPLPPLPKPKSAKASPAPATPTAASEPLGPTVTVKPKATTEATVAEELATKQKELSDQREQQTGEQTLVHDKKGQAPSTEFYSSGPMTLDQYIAIHKADVADLQGLKENKIHPFTKALISEPNKEDKKAIPSLKITVDGVAMKRSYNQEKSRIEIKIDTKAKDDALMVFAAANKRMSPLKLQPPSTPEFAIRMYIAGKMQEPPLKVEFDKDGLVTKGVKLNPEQQKLYEAIQKTSPETLREHYQQNKEFFGTNELMKGLPLKEDMGVSLTQPPTPKPKR